jgi:hypothetical protein
MAFTGITYLPITFGWLTDRTALCRHMLGWLPNEWNTVLDHFAQIDSTASELLEP